MRSLVKNKSVRVRMIGVCFTEGARNLFFTTLLVATKPVQKCLRVFVVPEGRLFGVKICPFGM